MLLLIDKIMKSLEAYYSNPEVLIAVLWKIVSIIMVYLISRIILKIARKMIKHIVASRNHKFIHFDERRANTLSMLLHNVVTYTVNIISVMLILSQLGVNLAPLLAGAGIVGLAIGFGAQSLVRDMITGFFIIIENQFAVGDLIQVEQFKGNVEEIGIRVTRIRSDSGEVLIVPNGNIRQIINYSIHHTVAMIDVSITTESDLVKALAALEEISDEVQLKAEFVKRPELLGIQMLTGNQITLRIKIECYPNQQLQATRTLNEYIKRKFDAAHIQLS
jgi:small-conductance mechanosensitive channel